LDFISLLNSALTFAVVMVLFLLFDRVAKTNRFKNRSWKFWAGLFGIYMVITYVLRMIDYI